MPNQPLAELVQSLSGEQQVKLRQVLQLQQQQCALQQLQLLQVGDRGNCEEVGHQGGHQEEKKSVPAAPSSFTLMGATETTCHTPKNLVSKIPYAPFETNTATPRARAPGTCSSNAPLPNPHTKRLEFEKSRSAGHRVSNRMDIPVVG